MDISSAKQERGVLVTLVGRMDAVTAAQFEQACDPWIKGGEKNIVADMTRLEYISSMGLGTLLAVAKKLQPNGGKLSMSAGCVSQRNADSSELLEGCIGIFKAWNQLVETRESKYFLDHAGEPANGQLPAIGLELFGHPK